MINSALNKGIALDIDDTLSATAQTIYTKFHWTIKEASSEFDEIFRSHHRLNEYYSSDPQFIERIEQEVNDANFFTDIQPYEGAYEAIQELHQQQLLSCYLTARPSLTQEVTQDRLVKHSFPSLPLFTKPNHLSNEEQFIRKAHELSKGYKYWIEGIVDDQIDLLTQMQNNFPDYPGIIHLILHPEQAHHIDTSHITSIQYTLSYSWEEVLKHILNEATKN